MIKSLELLEKKGDICLSLSGLKTYVIIDFIFMLQKYFKNIEFITLDIVNYVNISEPTIYIKFKFFKGISKKELNKYLKIIEELDTITSNKKQNKTYVSSVFDIKIRKSKEYLQLVKKLKNTIKHYTKKKKEKLFDIYKTFINITDEEKYESFSIVKSIPDDFSEELAKGLHLFGNKLIELVENGIHFSDFFNLNDEDNKNIENYKEIFYKKIKEYKLQKRKDWIKMFDFKKSKKSFLF